jgi:hypothetical protein
VKCAEEALLRREDSAKPNPKGTPASAQVVLGVSNHGIHGMTRKDFNRVDRVERVEVVN